MKTAEEILKPYIENMLGVKIVSDDNALKAMEEYASQFNPEAKEASVKCEHKNVRENLQGGRFDECLDCGKIWG